MRTTITFALYAISASAILVSAAPVVPSSGNGNGNGMMIRDGGSAYTGAGGSAVGGSLAENNSAQSGGLAGGDDILGVASGNAGDGGKATSGTALGGTGATTVSYVNGQPVVTTSNGGSAYSGVGGNTNGGNINQNNNAGPYTPNAYYANGRWFYDYETVPAAGNLDALNIASGNAGDGGDSSSGNAIGGSASPVGAYGWPVNGHARYY
ncbi:hypothetical protein I302_105033 [Kwoniella bestiolae CBS 10118]|uniref:Uncharacterized protein n=1 Tax=Kwoniella bestiolae CBS 10118 TaxID=1296100 RepID=A0A1B9FR31_9TREE|nr:hypothetical protein I302_08893 [Kwoniella bestiolae CBS 10118]OCF21221.1 hypothetical protein I302_08893 [Kwoniella bestiolae CBS 10118]